MTDNAQLTDFSTLDGSASRETRPVVLITGAGGAAAVTLLRALAPHADLVAADIDPLAVGLYLVPESRRLMLPRGDDPGFADALLQAAIRHGADLVIPTVDVELAGVSAARRSFTAHGIKVLVESVGTLELCLDKLALVDRCRGSVAVPMTRLVGARTTFDDLSEIGTPFLVKPRRGAGGRGVAVIRTESEFARVARDDSMLAQEYLPGAEYSIDVLAHPVGGIVAAVPRRRDRVDSGIAIASRTVADPELEQFGREVARIIGATGVVNVQCKRNSAGTASLLEVNPRFPGTMPLTIAAGVNMPVLAVRAALGQAIPAEVGYREIAIVRHWEDVIVATDEYSSVLPVSVGRTGEHAMNAVASLGASGPVIETSIDLHTHSTLTDGFNTPREMSVHVAASSGLAAWGLSDHVRSDSDWVDEYIARVRRLDAGPVHVLCGVEAKLLDEAGRLDLPAMRSELDYVLIADHQFPTADGPQHPRDLAARLAAGQIGAADVVETLVASTIAAAVRAPAYPIAVHPFSLLPKVGLSEDAISERMLDEFASAAASVGLAVEINEKWRCPSPRIVAGLARRGVTLLGGSDAHRSEEIGVWDYVHDVERLLDAQAPAARVAERPLPQIVGALVA